MYISSVGLAEFSHRFGTGKFECHIGSISSCLRFPLAADWSIKNVVSMSAVVSVFMPCE